MKPAAWLAIGGVATVATAVGLFLARKGAGVPPPPPTVYGETEKVSLAVPSGWRRATGAEVAALPELQAQANALLSTPGFSSMQYGTLTPFVASNGQTYATWIEQHWHKPGGELQPWGLHHGVTMLARAGVSV